MKYDVEDNPVYSEVVDGKIVSYCHEQSCNLSATHAYIGKGDQDDVYVFKKFCEEHAPAGSKPLSVHHVEIIGENE